MRSAIPELPLTPHAWLAGLLAFCALARYLPRWGCVALILLISMGLGVLIESGREDFPDWLILRAPGLRDVAGTVVSYPDIGFDVLEFTLDADTLPGRLLVRWSCDEPIHQLHVGGRVRVYGRTRLPEPLEGFDYPEYLRRRGIFAIVSANRIEVVEGATTGWSVRAWGDRLRQTTLRRLREALSPKLAALAQSLLFGDRSALPPDIEDAFSRTGLMHLLAVSGLHLGIFLAGAWWGLRKLGLRPRCSYPVIGLLILGVLIVIGPRVSLVRAGMLFGFLGLGAVLADCGIILRRWIHPLNGLAATGIILLCLHPGALYEAGFQLTMAATGSILIAFSPSGWGRRLLEGPWATVRWRGWRWLLRLAVVSAAAQAGAVSVIAWHFEGWHPLAIVVNLIAVPLAALSLWLGLGGLVWISTTIFPTALIPFAVALRALSWIVERVVRVPFIEVSVRSDVGVWMAGGIGFLLLTAYWLSLSSLTSKSTSMELESKLEPEGD